jgi:hypothetical protein
MLKNPLNREYIHSNSSVKFLTILLLHISIISISTVLLEGLSPRRGERA